MTARKQILTIIISLCFPLFALAQQHIYSGKVTDAEGKALGNVSVILINEKGNNVKFTPPTSPAISLLSNLKGKASAR